ncbi:MAG TPA: hypothetical protein PKY60_06915, partial [Thermoflexales bacterium]|nr:hypothetical protein [Thermoflexales bacterium]
MGLPLAIAFARVGRHVVGVDVDRKKISALENDVSYIPDVPTEDVKQSRAEGFFTATTDYDALKTCDVIFICVPTPYDAMRAPDL